MLNETAAVAITVTLNPLQEEERIMATKKPARVKAKKTSTRSKAPKKAAPLMVSDSLRHTGSVTGAAVKKFGGGPSRGGV